MTSLEISVATQEDDPEMRQLLRENPLPGRLQVTFEREPDFFIGAAVEGPYNQTIIARDRELGHIVGMVSRSIREVYCNGRPDTLGYYSQMRIAAGYRSWRRAMSIVGRKLQEFHQDGRTSRYLNSVVADNIPARRLLTAGIPGLPRLHEYARFHTLAILAPSTRKQLPLPDGTTLVRGAASHIPELLDCLRRNGLRYQFSPVWTEETLFHPQHTPGLSPQDFWLAFRENRMIGCLGVWDQLHFKQTVLRGYDGWLARYWRLINTCTRLIRFPQLPQPNTPVRYCFASHLAVDEDAPDVFLPLFRKIHNDVITRGYRTLMLGLPEDHPFLRLVKKSYVHLDYASQFYLSNWESEASPLGSLDDRLPGVEACLL